jgi:hypothetical protein
MGSGDPHLFTIILDDPVNDDDGVDFNPQSLASKKEEALLDPLYTDRKSIPFLINGIIGIWLTLAHAGRIRKNML